MNTNHLAPLTTPTLPIRLQTNDSATFIAANQANWVSNKEYTTTYLMDDMSCKDDVNPAPKAAATFDLAQASDPREQINCESGNRIQEAMAIIDKAFDISPLSVEAVFSDEFVAAARVIKAESPNKWEILRDQIRQLSNGNVRMNALDKVVVVNEETTEDVAERSSIASELVQYVTEKGELFTDPATKKAYVSWPSSGVDQLFVINSDNFKARLSYEYYLCTQGADGRGKTASESAIKQAILTLSGLAQHNNIQHEVHLRVAENQGKHYLFIADHDHQSIEIDASGWQVIASKATPVKFWKPTSMQALPAPVAGGDLDLLWRFVNIPVPGRPLILAWLLESLRANTPKPVLSLFGLQGSAKSSSQNKLRQLIDNNTANLRTAPRAVEDVNVSSAANWMISFENMSSLSYAMQDTLCSFATGAGTGKRKLYSDHEEAILQFKRPVVINGIPCVITAQDLMDRVICIELPVIDDYIEETTLDAEWSKAKPHIFGGLLDLFVKTLAKLPAVKLNKPPRMADFTKLGEAMMQAQGCQAGEFQKLYEANRQLGIDTALTSSPVAQAIEAVVAKHKSESPVVFYGTLGSLLKLLSGLKGDAEDWPRSERKLGDEIKRQVSALKTIGIDIVKSTKTERLNGERGFTVKIIKNASYASLEHQEQIDQLLVDEQVFDATAVTLFSSSDNLGDSEMALIMDYLHAIGESDQESIDELIEHCRKDNRVLDATLKMARSSLGLSAV